MKKSPAAASEEQLMMESSPLKFIVNSEPTESKHKFQSKKSLPNSEE